MPQSSQKTYSVRAYIGTGWSRIVFGLISKYSIYFQSLKCSKVPFDVFILANQLIKVFNTHS